MSLDFVAGAVTGLLFVGVGVLLVPTVRKKWTRYLISKGLAAQPCHVCGKALNDDNLSALERMVALAERTEHYVDVSFRPDESETRWRVIAKTSRTKPEVDLCLGFTLEEALSTAEYAAQQNKAYVRPLLRVVE